MTDRVSTPPGTVWPPGTSPGASGPAAACAAPTCSVTVQERRFSRRPSRYRKPTLFGAAYPSRLIHEIDAYGCPTYDDVWNQTRGELNLQNRKHREVLLSWLNHWNSRTAKAAFPFTELRRWQRKWQLELPKRDLAALRSSDLDALCGAYGALEEIGNIGPTIASKILFAACPRAAMMWDKAVQVEFGLSSRADGYRGLLEESQCEATALINSADQRGVTIKAVLSAGRARTLAKVLDAYHWITITRGHAIPSDKEVQQWLKLIG